MPKGPIRFDEGMSMRDFRELYRSEERCRNALFQWRWPDGYRCPGCGFDGSDNGAGPFVYRCGRCGRQTSLLSENPFYFARLPLPTAFALRYLLLGLKGRLSTFLTPQRFLWLRSLPRRLRRTLTTVYKAMISDEYCGIYLNWSLPPRRWDNMRKVHWCYTRAMWRKNKLYAVSSGISWPIKATIFAWKRTRQFGPRVSRRTGIGMVRQFFDQVYLALRYFVPPRIYYFYDLYEPGKRTLAPMYIHDHEIVPLLQSVSPSGLADIVNEKRRFFQECRKFGLPVIPVIAEFENGKPAKWVGCGRGESLPRLDLFVKPADGKGGQGVKRLVYEEPDRHCTDDTIALTRAQVLNLISEYSRERPYILQERMFNHQAISSLSVGALCTIRVVTYRAPDGGTGVLTAVFKMATGTCINDNFATGGIGAPVEPDSGILGRAIAKYLPAERVERHPDTGHKIVGTRLPHWHEVTRLCMRAHEAFSALPFVGWDVAVTEKGPVLVEGNIEWGAESMQRAHDRPLGQSLFPEIFLAHVHRQRQFNSPTRWEFWSPEQAAAPSERRHPGSQRI